VGEVIDRDVTSG